MAYADLYNETETIEAGGDYWIKIKTTLTHGEKESADRLLHRVKGTMDERGRVQSVVAPDLEGYAQAVVTAGIVGWNLDEADGTVWALSPDSAKLRNVNRLPDKVFQKVYRRIEALNREDKAVDRTFRNSASGGDSVGDTGAADTPEISDGTEALGETWDTSGTAD